jgi:hypothetical protein
MSNPEELYAASWGGIRLWCTRVSTTNGRKLVIHDPTRGDQHPVDDQGLETRTTSCTIIFDDMEGETDSPKTRFDRLCALIEQGDAQIFTHPLRGSYLARVGRFDHDVDEYSVISAEIEFVPEADVPAITVTTAETSAIAGGDAVAAAADRADVALAELGAESPVTDQARAAAAAWQDDGTTVRQVQVDVAQLVEAIRAEVARLDLAGTLRRWRAHRAMTLLAESVVGAGRAATAADTARLMTVRITRPTALPALLAGIYGARDVPERARQARSLNDIRTPGWIEAGTDLRLPLPGTQPRRG